MPQFILAFPMNCGVSDSIVVSENVSIAADTKNVMIPGCGVPFNVVRKEAVPSLVDIFKEHQDISVEAASAIEQHKSLLFLLGEAKSIEDVAQVNVAILKLFAGGAQGVFMQQSGTAWSVDGFREELADGEYPMDPWINFVENGDLIYTLGLACFALPDLSISSSAEEPQETLLLAADAIFGDGIPAKSGSEVKWGEDGVYVLRQEAKIPFPKDSPEFNKGGILRLNKKK